MELIIKISGIEEALQKYPSDIVSKAARSAINKTTNQAITRIRRKIIAEYNIKPSKLSKFLFISRRPSKNNLESAIMGLGAGLKLSYFNPKQEGFGFYRLGTGIKGIKRTRKKRGDVTAEIKKGQRKKIPPIDGRKPFLVQLKTGHIGVFARLSTKKLPIKELYGPGVAIILGSKNFKNEIQDKFIHNKFAEIFNHELEFFANKPTEDKL